MDHSLREGLVKRGVHLSTSHEDMLPETVFIKTETIETDDEDVFENTSYAEAAGHENFESCVKVESNAANTLLYNTNTQIEKNDEVGEDVFDPLDVCATQIANTDDGDIDCEEISSFLDYPSSDEGEEDILEEDSEDDSYSTEDSELEETVIEEDLLNSVLISSPTENVEAPKKKRRIFAEDSHECLNKIVFKDQQVIGQNGFSWKSKPNCETKKKRTAEHITNIRPGTTVYTSNTRKPFDCFQTFFTEGIFQIVQTYTNKNIENKQQSYAQANLNTVKTLEIVELKALLGLYIMAGAMRNSHLDAKFLFTKGLAGERYRATMSFARFAFLTSSLQFDNRETRKTRKIATKLAAINEIWDILIENCKKNYRPGPFLTIDEQFIEFKGNCPFRVYTPSKPNKYGIKIVMMCDAATKYMINALPYLGKGTSPDGISVADYFTLKLVEPVKDSNRNITTDSWFTSIDLAKNLLQNYKVTTVGTIKSNKNEFPGEFTDLNFQNRKTGSSLFLFSENLTSVSFKLKPNKLVTLISTMHDDDDTIDKESGKPLIVRNYNETKSGVCTFHQMSQNMNIIRNTKRWPLIYFYNMINIALINSYIIYLHNFCKYQTSLTKNPLSRFEFMIELANELTEPWIRSRLDLPISTDLRLTIKRCITVIEPKPELEPATNGSDMSAVFLLKKKYCTYCHYKKKRRTKSACVLCKKPICLEHTTKICLGRHIK